MHFEGCPRITLTKDHPRCANACASDGSGSARGILLRASLSCPAGVHLLAALLSVVSTGQAPICTSITSNAKTAAAATKKLSWRTLTPSSDSSVLV